MSTSSPSTGTAVETGRSGKNVKKPRPVSKYDPRGNQPPNRVRVVSITAALVVAAAAIGYFGWGLLATPTETALKHAPHAQHAFVSFQTAAKQKDLSRLKALSCSADASALSVSSAASTAGQRVTSSQSVSSTEAVVRAKQSATSDLFALDAMKLEGTSAAPQWTVCTHWPLGDLAAQADKVIACHTGTTFPATLPSCAGIQRSAGTADIVYKQQDGGKHFSVCVQADATAGGAWYTFTQSSKAVTKGTANTCT